MDKKLTIEINDIEVQLIKNSNTYIVKDEVKYLSQLIWDKATDSIVEEIKKELSKKEETLKEIKEETVVTQEATKKREFPKNKNKK